MRTGAITAISLLLLYGCGARADDRSQDNDIFATVEQIMCAKGVDERESALLRLADQIENYQATDEDDTPSGAVEVGLDDISCRQSPPAR